MKIRLAIFAVCVSVVAAGTPRTSLARDEAVPPESAHRTLLDDANASAQAATDMSYGGTADTRSAAGQRTGGKPCLPRSQWDLFFGQ